MSSEWIGQLRSIEQQFDRERESVADLRSLKTFENRYLSRKSGLLTLQLQNVRNVPPRNARRIRPCCERSQGQDRNRAGSAAAPTFPGAEATLLSSANAWTSPFLAIRRRMGHRHPLTLARQEIEDIFVSMGYTVEDGPEVEKTYYNFEALNISAKPSRTRSEGHVLH